jgi:predicted ATPase
MANADLERFRQKLREYRLLVNRSQGDLAAYLNLDYSELSNRLNAHKNAHLSHDNVRTLVRALAEWGAITTRSQAEELLDLMLCPHFDPADWQARPLSKLTSFKASPSTPPIPPFAPVAAYPVNKAGAAPPIQTEPASSPPPLLNPQTIDITDPAPEYNLPMNLNPLLGREEEIAQVLELLGKPNIRLVTLTGAGGSGKTSLALEIGNQFLSLPAFGNGVYFIRLENVTRRESLITEIAGTFKVNETAGRSLLQSLKEYLKNKKLLLIMDNFEQLVAEASVLSELLKETTCLKLLVTSRIPLHLSFEHEFPVGPLALPDKEIVSRLSPKELAANYPGIALFLARAQAVKPDFALSRENMLPVVEICQRLDGLPLALELAAARVRTFNPHKLLERLSLKVLTGGARDLPARQKTLWDTIAWSYDLLTGEEQRLFARLAIFVGGCTLEAAEAVCNPAGELALEVFEGLESLLTRNLLKQWEGLDGETRYGMLVTIREFGLEKLAKSGEFEELERRFAAYYLTLTRKLPIGMIEGSSQGTSRLHQIEIEYVNFRVVIYEYLEQGKAEEALELSVALGDYYDAAGGYVSEGVRFLEQALALPYSDASPTAKRWRASALWWVGALLFTENFVIARGYIDEALLLQRELNDKPGIIYSLNRLSWFEFGQANFQAAERYLQESLALSLELGDVAHLENTRSSLGMLAYRQSKFEESRRYAEENLAMCREAGYNRGIAVTLHWMGELETIRGNYVEARRNLDQSLAWFREQNIVWGVIISLNLISQVAISQDGYAQARAYSNESLALCRKFELRWGIAYSKFNQGLIAIGEGNFREAHTCLDESLAIQREWGEKFTRALFLSVMGLIASKQGERMVARRYYEESLELSQKMRNRLYVAQGLTGLGGLWVQAGLNGGQHDASNSSDYLGRVARLSGAITDLLTSCGAVMLRPFTTLYEQNLVVARANLALASFEAAFAEGQAMTLDEAVAYALSQ